MVRGTGDSQNVGHKRTSSVMYICDKTFVQECSNYALEQTSTKRHLTYNRKTRKVGNQLHRSYSCIVNLIKRVLLEVVAHSDNSDRNDQARVLGILSGYLSFENVFVNRISTNVNINVLANID